MTVVPTGLPAWTRTADLESYGGHLLKRNHMGGGVIDATTDVGAEDFSRLTSDLAAAVRTAPMAVITYLNNDSSPAAPTIESVHMMTGVRLVAYPGDSPPVGLPSAARNGNGDVTFTFAATYSDEYGVPGSFSVRSASATSNGSAFVAAPCEIVDATHVRVRCLNGSGAVQNQRVTLVVG
jgi:hypothetical protein